MTDELLLVGERRGLARGPAGREPGDAALDLRLDERVQRVEVGGFAVGR